MSPHEPAGDHMLGVVEILDFKITLSGFQFFQSLCEFRNGVTREKWIVDA